MTRQLSPSRLTPQKALIATFCCLLWSGAYITGKLAIGTADAPGFGAFRLAFFRFAIAGLLLFFWLFLRSPQSLKVERSDWGTFARLALLGMGLTYVFNYSGLAITSGTAAALIMASEPIWIAALAIIFLKEQLTIPRVLGILFGLVGALVVVLSTQTGSTSTGSNPLLGNLLIVFSLLFEAGAVLTVKKLTAKYSGMTIVTYEFLLGSVLLAPAAIWETVQNGIIHPTHTTWFSFAYLLVGCTLLAYPLWFRLLETTDASDVTTFIFLQPVVGTLIGILLLHEPLSLWSAVGAVCVLFGVWNLTAQGGRSRKRAAYAATPESGSP